MSGLEHVFMSESRRYLCDVYMPAIERAIAPLSDGQIWYRPNERSNSIGNLMLHLSGNVREWIVGSIGRLPNVRHRQQEFDERTPVPKDELTSRLRGVLAEADAVLGGLEQSHLREQRTIRGADLTVAAAIYHVVEHFSGHTGQILWIAKSQLGAQ